MLDKTLDFVCDMKRFKCEGCGSEVYFDSMTCVSCGRRLGYHAVRNEMLALDSSGSVWLGHGQHEPSVTLCTNAEVGHCNWLVTDQSGHNYCRACRHNVVVPDLGSVDHRAHWQKIELAKRHLFYSLLRWRLPIPNRVDDDPARGLGFSFLADTRHPDGTVLNVLTGHDDGHITLNIAEADDAVRERVRAQMREPYRTLLGHFRHEVGHFYWDRLVKDGPQLDEFRSLFGDETIDYEAALKRYYENGAPTDWRSAYISEYATSHPWEDFAETWAHYMHVVDSLETARAYGLELHKPDVAAEGPAVAVEFQPYRATTIDVIVEAWLPLTLALNSINRSMGQKDFYPFVMNSPVLEKLAFIQDLIRGATHEQHVVARSARRS